MPRKNQKPIFAAQRNTSGQKVFRGTIPIAMLSSLVSSFKPAFLSVFCLAVLQASVFATNDESRVNSLFVFHRRNHVIHLEDN